MLAFQDRLSWVLLTGVTLRLATWAGGVVSGGGLVVPELSVDRGPIFPDVSTADTL